ncbi:MAG: hypothetical protein ACLFSB_14480 [Chitinispirillaceae bacterium]
MGYEPVKNTDHREERRISWGAIFAGVFVALGVQILLGFLGAAIGLAAVDPTNPGTFTIAAAIWLIISGIVSLFAGGWVAGRLSGEPVGLDRAIHGVVLWGLATLVSLFLITSTAMAIIGGAFGLVESTVTTTGEAAAQLVPQVGQIVQQQFGGPGSPISEIRDQAEQLLQQAADTLESPQQRQQIQKDLQTIYSALSQLATEGEIPDQSRQQIQQILVQRTDMSPQEAQSTLSDWIKQAEQAREQLMAQLDSVAQATEEAADTAAQASGWIFFILLLSLAAAIAGGVVASPLKKH